MTDLDDDQLLFGVWETLENVTVTSHILHLLLVGIRSEEEEVTAKAAVAERRRLREETLFLIDWEDVLLVQTADGFRALHHWPVHDPHTNLLQFLEPPRYPVSHALYR